MGKKIYHSILKCILLATKEKKQKIKYCHITISSVSNKVSSYLQKPRKYSKILLCIIYIFTVKDTL